MRAEAPSGTHAARLPCEVCGAAEPRVVLRSPRLDGPLVQCQRCGLYYVDSPGAFRFRCPDVERTEDLNERVDELGIMRRDVEEAEDRWRLEAAYERLARVRRFVPGGRLLDVGCSKGFFL